MRAGMRTVGMLEITRQGFCELLAMKLMGHGMVSTISMGTAMQECSMLGIIKEDIQFRLIIETQCDIRHIGLQLLVVNKTSIVLMQGKGILGRISLDQCGQIGMKGRMDIKHDSLDCLVSIPIAGLEGLSRLGA